MTCIACSFCFTGISAVTPLWLRDVQISPDGSQIAFCYKGDIYKVPTGGGKAVQLTTQRSYESVPIWSPDGRQIAFASDRNGNMDVYMMSSEGGTARRLTTHSASEIPSAFTSDGKNVVYTALIQDPSSSALFPTRAMNEVYQVSIDGGRPKQILATPAENICYNNKGNGFLYQDKKGFEDTFRKHHTSSVTRDIWFYDFDSHKHENLTKHAGEDLNPVFSPDGKTVYFLSERNKQSANVYMFSMDNPKDVKEITSFKKNPIRFLSISRTGLLSYTYDGEIYTQRPGASPHKVKIDLTHDDDNIPARLSYGSGAGGATISSDGKQVAFIVRGEVFVTSADYLTTKRITHTAAAEKGLSFASDNRTLAYASERDGNWQLYLATIERKEDPNFPNATLIKEEILLPSKKVERTNPQFSPDGKELAFIEDRIKLMVVDLATRNVRQITDGSTWFNTGGGFDYQWSPDGKWFTLEFTGNKHDPYTDIGLVKADGKGQIINLTNSGYSSGSPCFVLDGNAILFTTERYGMRNHASWGSLNDAMLVFLNEKAYDRFRLNKENLELEKDAEKKKDEPEVKDKKEEGKKKEVKNEKSKEENIIVELDNIEDRIVRLTPNSSNLGASMLSKDGETLYYFASFEGGYDLWKMDLRKRETKLLHKMNTGWSGLEMDKEGKNLFILGGGSMQKMDVGSGSLTPIAYRAEMDMDLAAERDYMFDHVYKQEKERFYDTRMHHVDWDEMTAIYRKFLPHINNNYDFSELLSEWLGELNVSHTGGRFYPSLGGDATANLGVLFDWDYTGKGLRINEVLEKSPFDRAKSKVKAGTIIEKIDGQDILQETDYYPLLNHKTGKKILVSLFDPKEKIRWEEVIEPTSNGVVDGLLYQRWVKQRAADVDKWSKGRLGYVHIESMSDGSFRTVYSDILGKYNDREGIIIDTRFNGGGRLHEDIEVLFSGKKYFTQVIRGREVCDMPSRRWNKPSIMVTCEANYSNAHGTPWVYKHQKIGKLVGMPVPGTMTSVSWETLQDPSLVFGIPIIGYQLPDGSYLENSQLEPDVMVANDPSVIVRGSDDQLKVAVEELLKELDSKK